MTRIKFEFCLTISFLVIFFLNFRSLILNSDDIFFTGDALQIQYWFQLISQTNLFGIDSNIASPVGDSIWSNPSLGTLISISALVFQDFFQFNSSQSLVIVFFLIGALNFVFTLRIARVIGLNFIMTLLLSVSVGLSPFYLEKIGALGVASFYPFIAILTTLILSQNREYKNLKREYVLLYVVIFTASFWWLIVIAVVIIPVLIFSTISSVVDRKIHSTLKYWLKVFFFTYSSLAFYFLISLQYTRLRGENRWQPWQSEIFSGKFSDLFLGSPFLSVFQPELISKISGGISPGAMGDRVGTVQTLVIIFVVFLIMQNLVSISPLIVNYHWIQQLILLSFILVLFYVSGGLGNFTSGFFVLFELTSPIRAWSRLIMIISIIGLVVLTIYLQKYLSRKLQIVFTSVFLFFIFADLSQSDKPIFDRASESLESEVSVYASSKFNECKILQIPVDTQPVPQDYLNENNGKFYYSGYKQYILEPDLSWSFGNWTHSEGWLYEASIPTVLDKEWLNARDENICGVIYDKEFAKWRQQSAEKWPGLRVDLGNPSFTNSRYDFYLMSKNE